MILVKEKSGFKTKTNIKLLDCERMSFVLDNGILQTKLDNECFLGNMLKGFESNNACLK